MGGKGKGKVVPPDPPAGKGKDKTKGRGKGYLPKKQKGEGKGKWVEKKPTVLVTGASGFVAGQIIKVLTKQGYTVHGTVRSLEDAEKVSHLQKLFPNLKLFEADLLQGQEGFLKAAEGCAYVLHAASPFQLSVADPEKDLIDPAVKGTESVMRAAAEAKVKRVVVTSSCAAVGPPQTWFSNPSEADKDKVFTEEDWNTTSTLQDGPYRLSKRMAEEKAVELGKELGIEVAAICPSFVLGPPLSKRSDGESVRLVKKMMNGELLAAGPCGGPVGLGCVDVRDVALAHVRAMEHPEAAGKRFILSSQEGYSHFDLVTCLAMDPKFIAYPLPTEAKECIYKPKYSPALAWDVLKVRVRPVEQAIKDMAKTMAELGIVERKIALKKPTFGKVADLSPDSKGVNLILKIVSCKKEEKEYEIVVGDTSGVVTLLTSEAALAVWGPIALTEGNTIKAQNCFVKMVKGYIRLLAGKWGKIYGVFDTSDWVPNTKNDLSSTEYELVQE